MKHSDAPMFARRDSRELAPESETLSTSDQDSARVRLRAFRAHLIGYFAVMAVLVVVNLATGSARAWFVWPMVGWGGVLAIHAAYVMGLFRGGGGS